MCHCYYLGVDPNHNVSTILLVFFVVYCRVPTPTRSSKHTEPRFTAATGRRRLETFGFAKVRVKIDGIAAGARWYSCFCKS